MKRIVLSLLLAGLALPAAAIDLNKIFSIGKKVVDSVRDIGPAEEMEMGAGMAASLLGASPLLPNPELQRYVNRVGGWLALQTERQDIAWHFGILDDSQINAYTTPGGYVLITRGLFERLRNESELAGVLAHEIAHVVQRHHLKAIQGGNLRGALGDAIQTRAEARGSAGTYNALKAFSGLNELYTRGLDKGDEFEADRMGVVIAARAGYNPYGLVAVLQTLDTVSPEDTSFALMFKTHPTPSSRLDSLDAAMGERLEPYAESGLEPSRMLRPRR
ncbi:M48 family metalloprotease [Chitinimonas lacunae]|uniref:M48 family metalloprotease n=1 Tax=Chitinimonas lacunae TaxID=1963018 RepID=A0ABV8MQV9_9NEIS